jgi:hypothetical protein
MMCKDFPVLSDHNIAVPKATHTMSAALADADADNDPTLGAARLDLGDLGTVSVNRRFDKPGE